MRALFLLISVLSCASLIGCGHCCDEAVKQARRDQVHIDALQTANAGLVADLKVANARAKNAEAKLATVTPPTEPLSVPVQMEDGSVKTMSNPSAGVCIVVGRDEVERKSFYLCKKQYINGAKCSFLSDRTADSRGTLDVAEGGIDCDQYDKALVAVAKK